MEDTASQAAQQPNSTQSPLRIGLVITDQSQQVCEAIMPANDFVGSLLSGLDIIRAGLELREVMAILTSPDSADLEVDQERIRNAAAQAVLAASSHDLVLPEDWYEHVVILVIDDRLLRPWTFVYLVKRAFPKAPALPYNAQTNTLGELPEPTVCVSPDLPPESE